MTAPQQIFIDERNDAAYVVEYAPSGKLWSVNLASGAKTTVLSNLENAVGMTLSADRSRDPRRKLLGCAEPRDLHAAGPREDLHRPQCAGPAV